MVTEKQIEDYVAEIQEATNKHFAKNYPSLKPDTYEIRKGKRYYKIINSGGGVHCFVDMDGNIWKAASWKAPQKNGIRGHINDEKRPLRGYDFYVRY